MEQEKILKEILNEVHDTRNMVSSMNKQRRFANFVWAIKWLVIAGALYGAYSAAQPYFKIAGDTVKNVNNLNSQVQQLNSIPTNAMQNFLKQFVK